MAATDTKQRILDAAQQLFGEKGFAATSLRAITTAAGTNVASVNYHHGSKDELAKAVVVRLLGPINKERLERLDACEQACRGHELELEQVIEAFLAPALKLLRHRGETLGLTRLMGRIYAEQPDFLEDLFAEQFGDLVKRFVLAFERCLPDKQRDLLFWRMHFMVGAMAHTLCSNNLLALFTGGLCDPDDVDRIEREMISFVAGGMRAAATSSGGSPR